MAEILNSLLKLLKKQDCDIDSFASKCFYRVLPTFLVTSVICIYGNKYLGSPGVCYFYNQAENADMAEFGSRCLTAGTHIYAKEVREMPIKLKPSHPGIIGDHPALVEIFPGIRSMTTPPPEKIHHLTYVFLPHLLIFFVVCNVGTRYAWRVFAGDLLKRIRNGLHNPSLPESEVIARVERSADILASTRLHQNNLAIIYTISLILNMFILIFQYVILDIFLGISKLHFGFNAASQIFKSYEDWNYDIARIFPLVTICNLKDFGLVGGKNEKSGLCHLMYNRIFLVVVTIYWFLIQAVFILFTLELVHHILILIAPAYRLHILCKKLHVSKKSHFATDLKRLIYGSAFVIIDLAKNIPKDLARNVLRDSFTNDMYAIQV